ncbi:MAG: ExeM/NucH family extracellular endonuclease [Cytophagales bacterium]|nr:MAG: ExeM/NucH family extracellular endonuclease [Cytophagales bacterium]TAF61480.1 MAG: ExeM/NucH family extracellular endonuclease [Cytophagales bacterium]
MTLKSLLFYLVFSLLLCFSFTAQAQIPFTEDFNSYTGTGFDPAPVAGRLDSDLWTVAGFSDGATTFGGTSIAGDFARGNSPGNVTTGGLYSFTVAAGNNIVGVQPTGSDWNVNGTLTLRLNNTTGSTVSTLNLSYDIWTFNDQPRGNSLNLSYSTDGVTFTPLPAADFTTPAAATGATWASTPRSIAITGLSLAAGSNIFIRWTGNDVVGTGGRDEYGIDNVSVSTGAASPPNLVMTELMYNCNSPEPTNQWEWVEIYNAGATAVNLSGFVFDDDEGAPLAAANIASGSIPAGQTAVLYNADALAAADFSAAWGSGINLVAVTNWPSLSNNDDVIALWQSIGSYGARVFANAIDQVSYDGVSPWPIPNNASSIYLNVAPTTAANDIAANWTLSVLPSSTVCCFATYQSTATTTPAAHPNSGGDFGSPGPFNTPPVVAIPIPDQVTTVGTAFTYTFPVGTFTDADGDALSYSAVFDDLDENPIAITTWLNFDPATRTFSGTAPDNSFAGIMRIKVKADDGRGGKASDVFVLRVNLSPTTPILTAAPIGRYSAALVAADFNTGAAEIPAHDPASQRLFVVNGSTKRIDVLNITTMAFITSIDLSTATGTFSGGSANSVACKGGILAIAVQNSNAQLPGEVLFYNAAGPYAAPLSRPVVGALPDMLVFTKDGKKVLVANEGEPTPVTYAPDPVGSVSIIDITSGVGTPVVTTATFAAFDASAATLKAAGVHLTGYAGATLSQDLEPEYIAVSDDGATAWITLQENNAIAKLNILTSTITEIKPLGTRNHRTAVANGNGLDATDSDVGINIARLPIKGMYQPDAIHSFMVGSNTYLLMANEGDARDYGAGFQEEVRVNTLTLDAGVFPNAAAVQNILNAGRVGVTNRAGDTDGDGDFDDLWAFGTRSFSVRDANANLIYDSGDDFEQITALTYPSNFNCTHSGSTGNTIDSRSDNKGPEPEGIAYGEICGKKYVFVGLERIGGVMVYDITNPVKPIFVQYLNNRNFGVTPLFANVATVGDLGPEGLIFIPASESHTGSPLLVVCNEVSGSTSVFQINVAPAMTVTAGPMYFTSPAVGTPSGVQTYTVQGNCLTNDLNLTTSAPFEISLAAGGPFSSAVTIPVATANAGPVTIYIRFVPTAVGVTAGNVLHASTGVTSVNLPLTGEVVDITKIHTVQGTTDVPPVLANFTLEGIVVGDFQEPTATGGLGGFYLQEEDFDKDALATTSEGIFVFSMTPVNVGDRVRVTGLVNEFFNQTQIGTGPLPPTVTVINTGNPLPVASVIDFPVPAPVAGVAYLERFENMYINIPETMTTTDHFRLGRFGEVGLSADGRLINPSNEIDLNDAVATGTTSTGTSNLPALLAQADLNRRRLIILDDGLTQQNPTVIKHWQSGINTHRLGTTVDNLFGVMSYGFSAYRIQPLSAALPVFNFAPRPTVPTVGAANLKVASFNVLNYFNGDGLGGGFPTSRGADNMTEFMRQRTKTFATLAAMNADVVGLIEVENDGIGANSALQDLVNGLNAFIGGAPTYSFIADPVTGVGTDEIKVAIIYKSAVVSPIGASQSFASVDFDRLPVAQTFQTVVGSHKFTYVINHFKSKSCTGASGIEADAGDGQGCWNAKRKRQATALMSFIDILKTTACDGDIVTMGDYNAYEQEDPMDFMRAGGLTSLIENSYSFMFDAQSGSLDHALATASMAAQLTSGKKWHINGDEPVIIDYNTNFKVSSGGTSPDYYTPTPFRSSDHDPVLVGFSLANITSTSTSPLDNATGVSLGTTAVTITFTSVPSAGCGNLIIRRTSDGVAVATVAATTATVSGNAMTFNVGAVFTCGESYYVEIQPTAISNFAGINTTTAWNFTIETPCASIGSTGTIPPPLWIYAKGINTTSIDLRWYDLATDELGYRIYRALETTNEFGLLATVPAGTGEMNYVDTGLSSDTRYVYFVRPYKGEIFATSDEAIGYTYPNVPKLTVLSDACFNESGKIKATNDHKTGRFFWYESLTAIAPILNPATGVPFEGSEFTTPPITMSRTFYVTAMGREYESTPRQAVTVFVKDRPVALILGEKVQYGCASTLMLEAEDAGTGSVYNWYKNKQFVTSTTVPSYKATQTGFYSVQVVRNGCLAVSAEIRAVVNYKPIAQILEGSKATFCESGTLNAKRVSDATYEWFLGTTLAGTGESLPVIVSGTYTLVVSKNGCSNATDVTVVVESFPANMSLSASSTELCANTETELTAPSIAGASYQWFRNGKREFITATNTLRTTRTGVFYAVINKNGCLKNTDELTISRLNTPKVTLKDNTLTGILSLDVPEGAVVADVRWFLNGEEQAEFTGKTSITPTKEGVYKAQIGFANGCNTETNTVRFFGVLSIKTDEGDNWAANLLVYPNPTRDIVYLSLQGFHGLVVVEVSDVLGRVLSKHSFDATSTNKAEISLQGLSTGTYNLKINTSKGEVVKTVAKSE